MAKVEDDGFSVSVIPHTSEETTLLKRKPGDIVNLENDLVGKYVERLLGFHQNEEKNTSITMEWLKECGI